MGEIKINPIKNVHDKYNKVNIINPYRFGVVGSNYEPETVAYMAAVGITDNNTLYYSGTPQEITGNGFYLAIDKFIKSLKGGDILQKLKAVYPFIGGNASTHKWNLINPQDANSAFRVSWFGGGGHSSTGWKGNGINAYGETYLNQSLQSQRDNESFGVYVQEVIDNFGRDIATINNSSAIISHFTGKTYVKNQTATWITPVNIVGNGFRSGNRVMSTSFTAQVNADIYSINSVSANFVNSTFNLGREGTAFTSRTLSYAFIGDGLTDAQMTDHYIAVQQLQTDLKRQV